LLDDIFAALDAETGRKVQRRLLREIASIESDSEKNKGKNKALAIFTTS